MRRSSLITILFAQTCIILILCVFFFRRENSHSDQIRKLENNLNTLLNNRLTALDLGITHPNIKDIELRNKEKDSFTLSSIINHNSTVILIKISDCRLCFDTLVGNLSDKKITPINGNLDIVFVSKSFNDFLYFEKSNILPNTEIYWTNDKIFGEYYNLGLPLIMQVDSSLNISNISYLNFHYPEIGLTYFE